MAYVTVGGWVRDAVYGATQIPEAGAIPPSSEPGIFAQITSGLKSLVEPVTKALTSGKPAAAAPVPAQASTATVMGVPTKYIVYGGVAVGALLLIRALKK